MRSGPLRALVLASSIVLAAGCRDDEILSPHTALSPDATRAVLSEAPVSYEHVTAPGVYGGVTVQMTPYWGGNPYGEFQSTYGPWV